MPVDEKVPEHRFAHLLKPIRDLAQNWNIDIANELADYLTTVEELDISFEDTAGVDGVNFAEAALILQGSASVYSKKVEFLYNLIWQCLDIVAKKSRRMKKKSSIDENGDDSDAVVQAEAEFLTLDDVMEQAKNIDLRDEKDNDYRRKRQDSLIARTPLSALNTKSATKGRNGRETNDFKISECAIHASGALLFEERDSRLVDLSFRRDSLHTSNMPFGSPSSLLKSHAKEAKVNHDAKGGANGDEIVKELDFPNGDQSMAVGFQSDDDGPYDDAGFDDGGYDANQPQQQEEAQLEVVEEEDPWAMLDPHAECENVRAKPLRTGKTYRVPRSSARYNKLVSHTHKLVRLGYEEQEVSVNCLSQPSFGDFSNVYLGVLKRRHAARRAAKKGKMLNLREGRMRQLSADAKYPEDAAGGYSSGEEFDVTENADFDDGGQGFDPIDNDAPLPLPEDHMEGQGAGMDMSMTEPQVWSGQNTSMTFEDLCRKHVDAYVHAAQQYMTRTKLSQRVASWQDKIQPLLDEMDKRPEYDIHAYGTKIVDTIVETKSKTDDEQEQDISFGSLVSGKEKFDVCRIFLASLQLANHRRVDIQPTSENGVESLKLHLLEESGHKTDPSHIIAAAAEEKKVTVKKLTVQVRESPAPKRMKGLSKSKKDLNVVDNDATTTKKLFKGKKNQVAEKPKRRSTRRRGLNPRAVNTS